MFADGSLLTRWLQAERWESKKAVLKLEVRHSTRMFLLPLLLFLNANQPKPCFNFPVQVSVLKRMQGCALVCKYLHCGHFEEHNYLVMELLGESRDNFISSLFSPLQHTRQA